LADFAEAALPTWKAGVDAFLEQLRAYSSASATAPYLALNKNQLNKTTKT